jgi:hypothetical protein
LAAFGYRALVGLPSPGTGGLFGPATALLTLSLVVRDGLFLLPLGLSIPPTGGYGIEFDDNQRRLLRARRSPWPSARSSGSGWRS